MKYGETVYRQDLVVFLLKTKMSFLLFSFFLFVLILPTPQQNLKIIFGNQVTSKQVIHIKIRNQGESTQKIKKRSNYAQLRSKEERVLSVNEISYNISDANNIRVH